MKVKVYFEDGREKTYENVIMVSRIRDFHGFYYYVIHFEPTEDNVEERYYYLQEVKSLEITDK